METLNLKAFGIVEYSTGDYNEIGKHLGVVIAKDSQSAWEYISIKLKLTEKDKPYYSITEIKIL